MARGWLLLAGLPAWLCLLAPAAARPPQKAVLLEPVNPTLPALAQAITFPLTSVMVIMVLLKVD